MVGLVEEFGRGGVHGRGFYLWFDEGLAWAQGPMEYRPMGTAVIASLDLFRRRDFDPRRKLRAPGPAEFAGQFASLGP